MKKKLIIIIVCLLVAAAVITAVLILRKPKMKITVNPEVVKQEIYGWGASSCWWSQYVSDENVRKDLAKQLYSSEGLGLNIYRYNVGAGYEEENNRVDNPWRVTESFLVKDEKTGEWVYDFSRDKNAVDMMKECLSYQ